ncbi:VWA domain-containing protein [bacterium]|nr:VWA domain-containing protein [bacterium]
MEKKHQVHNLIILDESGSMGSIKELIISGFNELVQTIKGIEKDFPEQEHFISFVTFNGMGQKILHFMDPAAKLEMIDGSKYQPNYSTPLYDAMGVSMTKLKHALENQTDYNVLVTVLTDGEENASKEYNGAAIKKMVEELKLSGWTFTYIGTDHDVESFAVNISINNVMNFKKNSQDINRMFNDEKAARAGYSSKIRYKMTTDDDFYKKDDDQNAKS